MPVVLRDRGSVFCFYSNEGTPREAVHIHVEKGYSEEKFWLKTELVSLNNDSYDARTLRKLLEVVEANEHQIERASFDPSPPDTEETTLLERGTFNRPPVHP